MNSTLQIRPGAASPQSDATFNAGAEPVPAEASPAASQILHHREAEKPRTKHGSLPLGKAHMLSADTLPELDVRRACARGWRHFALLYVPPSDPSRPMKTRDFFNRRRT